MGRWAQVADFGPGLGTALAEPILPERSGVTPFFFGGTDGSQALQPRLASILTPQRGGLRGTNSLTALDWGRLDGGSSSTEATAKPSMGRAPGPPAAEPPTRPAPVRVQAAVRRHGRLVHGQHIAFPGQDRARHPGARERHAEKCPHHGQGSPLLSAPDPLHSWLLRARRSAGSGWAAGSSTTAVGPPEATGPGAQAGVAALRPWS